MGKQELVKKLNEIFYNGFEEIPEVIEGLTEEENKVLNIKLSEAAKIIKNLQRQYRDKEL